MGQLAEITLRPDGGKVQGEHLSEADLARLAEGQVETGEREELLAHVSTCPRCHQVLAETVRDLDAARAARQKAGRGLVRTPYALAASLILALVIGGGVLFQQLFLSPEMMTAMLTMDPELKQVLLQDESLTWTDSQRIARLAVLLQQRGVKVKGLEKVVLARPYTPSKSFLGPEEKLKIRIEKGVAYLEVIEEEEKKPPGEGG